MSPAVSAFRLAIPSPAGSNRATPSGSLPLPAETQLLVLAAAAEPFGDPLLLHRAAEILGLEHGRGRPGGGRRAARHEWTHRVRAPARPLGRLRAQRATTTVIACTAHLPRPPTPTRDPDRRAWHRARAASARTRMSPPSSNARPAAPRRVAASRQRPRSSSARRRCRLIREREHGARSRPRRPSSWPERPQAASTPRRRRSRRAARRARERTGAASEGYRSLSACGAVARRCRSCSDAASTLEAHRAGPRARDLPRGAASGELSGRFGADDAPPRGGGRSPAHRRRGHTARRSTCCSTGSPPVHRRLSPRACRRLQHRATRGPRRGQPPGPGRALAVVLRRRVALDLFDTRPARALATRSVQLARDTGALGVLPLALGSLATVHIFDGDLDAATRCSTSPTPSPTPSVRPDRSRRDCPRRPPR